VRGERSSQFFCHSHVALVLQVMSHTDSNTSTTTLSQTIPTLSTNMSDNSPHSSYALIPVLNKENFMKWEIQVRVYLTGATDHVCVIRHTRDLDGKYHDLAPPTNQNEHKAWDKLECIAMGIIMATASDLHLELIHRMSEEPVWDVWKAIKGQHQQQDASLCHEAWMQMFAICKKPTEAYVNYYQQAKAAHLKVGHITPRDLTPAQCDKELGLFTIINSLDIDDPLHHQLILQKDVALGDAYLLFLHTDRGKAIKTEVMELAHVALSSKCFLCQSPDHFAKDCPHRNMIASLVTRCNDSRGRRGRGHSNGFGSSTQAHTASSIRTSTSTTANNNAGTSKSTSQETAKVASAFLSCDLHTADIWLCDSGASSSMSSDCSVFLSLKPDQHLIRLADGKVIYSKGLGSI